MDIQIKFPSGQEFDRLLAEAEKKVSITALRRAGRDAMVPVLTDMKQNAGFDETSIGPHMRDNIKITSVDQTKNTSYPTAVTVRVGISKAHQMKGWAQERGTRKQVAKPFMRPALDYNRQKVLNILAIRLREELEGK
ncbi:hypothetical protein KOEU_37810 [Komagataeibacter europaeus]|uniref:Phage protein, HK97 gp10 family n=1 Tax=Komagataeibacter europaeus TaxID=33995 RepID=A0A0M0EBX1_KOMEU|nr:HK97-gp10 family putative phage morphogenesis protein [Komagataeibacter europaeus]KON62733.1 hypothetical protein KOEU_37810 [Komagataeibacter europaeus]